MRILWDEPKRLANIAKHGLDFADLDLAFFVRAVVVDAKRGRLKAVGWRGEGITVVIFVTLGREAISVVSMRRASEAERRLL